MGRHCPKRGSDGRSSPSPFENSTAQLAVLFWIGYIRGVIPPLSSPAASAFAWAANPYWAFVLVDGSGGCTELLQVPQFVAFGWVNHRVVVLQW